MFQRSEFDHLLDVFSFEKELTLNVDDGDALVLLLDLALLPLFCCCRPTVITALLLLTLAS